jgi:hypothetical protein
MTPAQNPPEFAWAAEMPLLTNRFYLYDGLKLFFWVGLATSVILGAIAAASGSMRGMLSIFEMFGLILGGFLLLFVLISWIFFGNRFPTGFGIGPQGIWWISRSRRARIANRLAVVAGAAGRSPATAGAGLLAVSGESGMAGWADIRRIKKYPDERVISIMNNWRVVIRLYCTPENYAYVAQLVDWYFSVTRPGAAVQQG